MNVRTFLKKLKARIHSKVKERSHGFIKHQQKRLEWQKAVKVNATHYILPFIQSVSTIGKVVYSMGPSHRLEFLMSLQER